MKLADLSASLNVPAGILVVCGARIYHQGERAAEAVIVTSREAEDVGKRGVTPGNVERGGAQTRGRAAEVAAEVKNAGLLDDHGGAGGHGDEVHAPATRAFRLDVTV